MRKYTLVDKGTHLTVCDKGATWQMVTTVLQCWSPMSAMRTKRALFYNYQQFPL